MTLALHRFCASQVPAELQVKTDVYFDMIDEWHIGGWVKLISFFSKMKVLQNLQLPVHFQVNWMGTQRQITAQTVQVGLNFITGMFCSNRHYKLSNSTTGSILTFRLMQFSGRAFQKGTDQQRHQENFLFLVKAEVLNFTLASLLY